MKLSKLSHEIIDVGDIVLHNPMEHIEKVARVCYKSEEKIAEGTYKKMIKNLFKNKHFAMLEHYRFIMKVPYDIYSVIELTDHPYINMTHCEYRLEDRYLISASARGIYEMCENSNAEHHGVLPTAIEAIRKDIMMHIARVFNCYELFGMDEDADKGYKYIFSISFIKNEARYMTKKEWEMHGWQSVLFHVDRGVSHEMVRHRPCSFAQESTRYCNYSGKGVEVIDPIILSGDRDSKTILDIKDEWMNAILDAERHYNRLIDMGCTAQDARSVLPHSTKVDMVVTVDMKEWLHIFDLRALGTTGKPHPMMQSVMLQVYEEFKERGWINE